MGFWLPASANSRSASAHGLFIERRRRDSRGDEKERRRSWKRFLSNKLNHHPLLGYGSKRKLINKIFFPFIAVCVSTLLRFHFLVLSIRSSSLHESNSNSNSTPIPKTRRDYVAKEGSCFVPRMDENCFSFPTRCASCNRKILGGFPSSADDAKRGK